MRCRKPRIAWSTLCGIACVMLVALWVRSYQRFDELRLPGSTRSLISFKGRVQLLSFAGPFDDIRHVSATAPHSLLAGLFLALAAAPWLRSRFSVRTLLIATALIAIVLGLIVYAMRK